MRNAHGENGAMIREVTRLPRLMRPACFCTIPEMTLRRESQSYLGLVLAAEEEFEVSGAADRLSS
jgi:hypothetical protein